MNLLKLISALNTDWDNRAAYINRIKQTERVTVFAEDGTAIEKDVEFFVNWESIKAVLELVRKKAGLEDDFRVSSEPESK